MLLPCLKMQCFHSPARLRCAEGLVSIRTGSAPPPHLLPLDASSLSNPPRAVLQSCLAAWLSCELSCNPPVQLSELRWHTLLLARADSFDLGFDRTCTFALPHHLPCVVRRNLQAHTLLPRDPLGLSLSHLAEAQKAAPSLSLKRQHRRSPVFTHEASAPTLGLLPFTRSCSPVAFPRARARLARACCAA